MQTEVSINEQISIVNRTANTMGELMQMLKEDRDVPAIATAKHDVKVLLAVKESLMKLAGQTADVNSSENDQDLTLDRFAAVNDAMSAIAIQMFSSLKTISSLDAQYHDLESSKTIAAAAIRETQELLNSVIPRAASEKENAGYAGTI